MLGTKRYTGFTLTEVLMVVVIVAVLVAVGLPAYWEYSKRGRRGDAINSLLKLALAQEKWRANHTEFSVLEDVWNGTDSLQGFYEMNVLEQSATHFLITAAPKPGGPQQGDECGTFAMNQEGPVTEDYAGEDCWDG